MRLIHHLRSPAHLPNLIWKNLKYPFGGAAAEARFDRRYNITTVATPEELAGGEGRAIHLAIPPRHGAALIASVLPQAAGFTFIDIGCSKGRALALARRHPFGRVIGIEQDPYFVAIARRNAAAIGGIDIVETDAFAYELPPDPTVFFLHRPFTLDVAERMGAHIMGSLHARPRKVFVLYYSYEFPVSLAPLRQREIKLPLDPAERFKESHFRGYVYES
jgi:SAM-dependent methyltransferase